jgi:hypothetical protein
MSGLVSLGALVVAVVVQVSMTAPGTASATDGSEYPTRCVLVTAPPDGRPLPAVCVLWPVSPDLGVLVGVSE